MAFGDGNFLRASTRNPSALAQRGTELGAGLLSQYGLDINPDQIRADKQAEREQSTLGLVNNMGFVSPWQQSAAQIGGLLGAKLAKPQEPDPEQMSRVATANEANQKFNEWNNGEGKEADAETKSLQYRRFLAESAFRNGQQGLGAQIMSDYVAQRNNMQKQSAELEKLGIETDIAKKTKEATIARTLIEAGKSGLIEVYPLGSNNPNASIVGMYDPADGSVKLGDGTKLPAGTWKLDRPMAPSQMYGRGSGGGGGGGEFLVTPSDAGGVRKTVQTAERQHRSILEVMDLLDEAEKNRGGGKAIIGPTGRGLSFVSKWVQAAEGLADAIAPEGMTTSLNIVNDKGEKVNLRDTAAKNAWIEKNRKRLRGMLPEDLRKSSHVADRYIAIITDLTYAKAMANEGGATRSLSDRDFDQNFRTIGGSLSDPQALKQILFADAFRTNENLNSVLDSYPEDTLGRILSPKGHQRYLDVWNRVQQRANEFRAPAVPEAAGRGGPNGGYVPPPGGGPPPGLSPREFAAWKQAHPEWSFGK